MSDKATSRLTTLTHYALVLQKLAAGPPYPIHVSVSTERFGFLFATAHTAVLEIPEEWIASVELLTEEDPFVADMLIDAVLASHLVALQDFIASIEPTTFARMAEVRGVNETVWQTGWQGDMFLVEFPVRQLLYMLHREIV